MLLALLGTASPVFAQSTPSANGAQSSEAPARVASAASAAPVDEARLHFDRGIQLYVEHAYEGALVEFERAHQLAPSYRILYNIGQIHQQLHHYAQAVSAFEQYLAQGGTNLPDARRTEVEQAIATLRPRVATLEVRINVPGAEIAVDDEVVGTAPLMHPLSVNPGRRRISATRPGYVPASSVVNVASSDALVVRLDLVNLTAAREAIAARPPAPRGPTRIPMYVGWIATAAMLIGSGVMVGMAHGESNVLVQSRNMFDTDGTLANTLQRERSSVISLALAADALWVSAIVSGGVAIYLTVAALTSHPPPRRAATRVGCNPLLLTCHF